MISFVVMLSVAFAFTAPVSAQVDRASCGHFDTQDDAHAALDENPELATTLDNDGDGIACETLPKGTGDETSTTGGETTTSGTSGRAIALPNTGAGAAEQDRTFPWTMPVTALVLTFGEMPRRPGGEIRARPGLSGRRQVSAAEFGLRGRSAQIVGPARPSTWRM